MFHQDVILPAEEFAYDKLTELQVDTVWIVIELMKTYWPYTFTNWY